MEKDSFNLLFNSNMTQTPFLVKMFLFD